MRTLKLVCTTLAALIVLTIFFLISHPAPAAAATVTLKYANFFPPTHVQAKLSEDWCKEVEKRTEGRIKVQFFPGETLAKAKPTYSSVLDGIADVGLSCLAYTRGRFPIMSSIDLPFGYTSGKAATAAINYIYEKYKPKEFDDTQVMYFHGHGPGFIHTRKKAVHKLEDLKGLKIRSTGQSSEIVSALGATPVTMTMPESYQSLQKGTVDGGIYPSEADKGFKLAEVIDYATFAYSVAYTTGFFVVMNKDKWNSIEARDQEVIRSINMEWALKTAEGWDQIDREGLRYFLQQGNTIIGLDEKESDRWRKAVEPIFDSYLQEVKQKNGIDTKPVIDDIREFLKKYESNQ